MFESKTDGTLTCCWAENGITLYANWCLYLAGNQQIILKYKALDNPAKMNACSHNCGIRCSGLLFLISFSISHDGFWAMHDM